MIDERDLFVRAAERFDPPRDAFQRFQRREDRRQRNRRIGAGALALAIAFVAFGVLVRAIRTSEPAAHPTPPASEGFAWDPVALWFAPDGALYVSSCSLDRIYRVGSDGMVRTFANRSLRTGLSPEGVSAQHARFSCPWGLAFDAAGNLFVADLNNDRVREIDPSGTVTTFAGSGPTGLDNGSFAGDGGLATRARLYRPTWIATDGTGNVYIADSFNNAIRKVGPDGIITTIAGGPTPGGSQPGSSVHAVLDGPAGIAFGPDGNLYVADSNRARIRVLEPDGSVRTFAGTGHAGYSGDGGPARHARIANPGGVAFDALGNLYFADTDNHVIRKITPSGIITTVVGTGQPGCPSERASAGESSLTDPFSVAVDDVGRLFITDTGCNAVFEVEPDGTVHALSPARPTD